MLYIYAENFCGGGQMAAAAGCSWDQFNRPVAGIVRFCYDSINLQPDGTADETTIMTNVETAIHEVSWFVYYEYFILLLLIAYSNTHLTWYLCINANLGRTRPWPEERRNDIFPTIMLPANQGTTILISLKGLSAWMAPERMSMYRARTRSEKAKRLLASNTTRSLLQL